MTEITRFDREPGPDGAHGATRVLVVAAQELFRDVLTGILSEISSIQIVGNSPPGHPALLAADHTSPDVVVIESEIGPEAEGVRSGYKIKAAHPSVGIVVLSSGLSQDIVRYLPARTNSGWSFLSRTAALDPLSLLKAIEASAEGRGCIDPDLERAGAPMGILPLERLTRQQVQALELIAAGASDMAIADSLNLSLVDTRRLIESTYDDMHISDSPRINRRIVATLKYLRDTVARLS
jgi:DNA-binding NarL/FixJ family response regulator